MLEPEHGAVWIFHFVFSSQKALYVLQPERALEFLRDLPQFSNLHTLLSEQSGQTGKCPVFPSTHTPWLGVLYLCLSLPGIIAPSSGDPGTLETGRSLMVDVAYQESGLAFLIVPVTTLGIGRVWDKCVLNCMPLLFLATDSPLSPLTPLGFCPTAHFTSAFRRCSHQAAGVVQRPLWAPQHW